MLLSSGIPALYQAAFSVIDVILANAMACHVYRAVKLGSIGDTSSADIEMTLLFISAPPNAPRQSTWVVSRGVHATKTMDLEMPFANASPKRISFAEGSAGTYDRVRKMQVGQ